MKNLRLFETLADFQSAQATLDKPNVSLIEATMGVNYLPYVAPVAPVAHDYSQDYFTSVALENCTFTFSAGAGEICYSLDNGQTWSEKTSNVTTSEISSGNKVLWKGDIVNDDYAEIGMSSTGYFTVEGNIMSLLYGDNFVGETDLTGNDYAFVYLFNENTNITSAENLSLPATTLATSCYYYMFSGCTNLTTAPELPATTLAYSCYENMFYGCTSLTTAPELPATTLAENCYRGMFYGCTSLTTAPELPATTLASYCYENMFYGCTSLTTAPELPAATLVNNCYENMFYGCTSLNSITCLATNISANSCTSGWIMDVALIGTFTKAASMSNWTTKTGANGIPSGWTVQNAS